MASPGVHTPVIDLLVTLATKRKDGSALAASDIGSVTILRNAVELTTLHGPFNGPVKYADASPGGTDTYSFYVTDSAGVCSDVSNAVSVVVSNDPVKAAPAVGTITAIVHGAKVPVVPAAPGQGGVVGSNQNWGVTSAPIPSGVQNTTRLNPTGTAPASAYPGTNPDVYPGIVQPDGQ